MDVFHVKKLKTYTDEEWEAFSRTEKHLVRRIHAGIVTEWLERAGKSGKVIFVPTGGDENLPYICPYCRVRHKRKNRYGFCSSSCGKSAFQLYRYCDNELPRI